MDGTDAMERLDDSAPSQAPSASATTLPGFVSAGRIQQGQPAQEEKQPKQNGTGV